MWSPEEAHDHTGAVFYFERPTDQCDRVQLLLMFLLHLIHEQGHNVL